MASKSCYLFGRIWLLFVWRTIVVSSSFKWGTATAAYQIEGSVDVDGRFPSIWDTFAAIPNKVHNNATGEIADDSYRRYQDDIGLMKNLNLSHYRFSISWPRILPDGVHINQAGLDHYRAVLDALHAADIEPLITLYHWDLPQSVYEATNGGWINASIVQYFKVYAQTIFDAFHADAKFWITMNEPWTFCMMGYDVGVHAPGRCTGCAPPQLNGNSGVEVYQCAHHVLLSHAAAVQFFREQGYDGQVGITLNIDWAEPASASSEDRAAAERSVVWAGAWFADPIFFGDYPQIMKDYIGERLPQFTDTEKTLLNGSWDFLGLNHYTTKWAKAVPPYNGSHPDWFTDQNNALSPCNPYNATAIGRKADSEWLYVAPSGLYHILKWVERRYENPPVFITENGCDVPDESSLSLEEALNDTFRVHFYDGYITAMTQAIATGADVRGYFAWSLLDNYEWADGYSKRFGLHYVNYTDLTRHPKMSAQWFSHYANVVNANASYIGHTVPHAPLSAEYAAQICPGTIMPTTSTLIISTNVSVLTSTSAAATTAQSNDMQQRGIFFIATAIAVFVLIVIWAGYKLWIRRKLRLQQRQTAFIAMQEVETTGTNERS